MPFLGSLLYTRKNAQDAASKGLDLSKSDSRRPKSTNWHMEISPSGMGALRLWCISGRSSVRGRVGTLTTDFESEAVPGGWRLRSLGVLRMSILRYPEVQLCPLTCLLISILSYCWFLYIPFDFLVKSSLLCFFQQFQYDFLLEFELLLWRPFEIWWNDDFLLEFELPLTSFWDLVEWETLEQWTGWKKEQTYCKDRADFGFPLLS